MPLSKRAAERPAGSRTTHFSGMVCRSFTVHWHPGFSGVPSDGQRPSCGLGITNSPGLFRQGTFLQVCCLWRQQIQPSSILQWAVWLGPMSFPEKAIKAESSPQLKPQLCRNCPAGLNRTFPASVFRAGPQNYCFFSNILRSHSQLCEIIEYPKGCFSNCGHQSLSW